MITIATEEQEQGVDAWEILPHAEVVVVRKRRHSVDRKVT